MFFQEESLSEMEKVDRIYRMLRAQQRSRRIGMAIKLLLIGAVVYGYYYLSLPAHADVRAGIMQSIQTELSGIVTPMVESMVGDMTANMTAPMMSGSTTGTGVRRRNIPKNQQGAPAVNITPEMIRAVQESMNK